MARLRTKREQREYVVPRARELASSGRFLNWLTIEHHLRYEEYCPEARHILDNERVREELNKLCKESQDRIKPRP